MIDHKLLQLKNSYHPNKLMYVSIVRLQMCYAKLLATVLGYKNVHKPRFFKKVCAHASTHNVVSLAEANLNVFAETTAVVVPRRFSITDRLMFTKATF